MRTFSAIWRWALINGHVTTSFPNDGLRYPKTSAKSPLQTYGQIEQRIQRGGLRLEEENELWECLFLTLPEIEELLRHVKSTAKHRFIYPMFVMAAHTGARR